MVTSFLKKELVDPSHIRLSHFAYVNDINIQGLQYDYFDFKYGRNFKS